MPITKVGRPCRDCKSITCYCHDPACTTDTTGCPALVPVETYGHHRADLAPSAPAPVTVQEVPTTRQLQSVCYSMRHDYGIMDREEQKTLEFRAKEAWRAVARALAEQEKSDG